MWQRNGRRSQADWNTFLFCENFNSSTNNKKTERREDFVVQEEVEKKETVKTRFYLVDGL